MLLRSSQDSRHRAETRDETRAPDVRPVELVSTGYSTDAPRGFTLVELLMGMLITTMLSIVLGGLSYAVYVARVHTNGLADATNESQAALDRIEYMVGRSGVYQIGNRPTRLGIAVVERTWSIYVIPDTLVIWSGGPAGSLAESGTLNRLPLVNELLIYTPDPQDPRQLLELSFPSSSATVDFDSSDFADTVRDLIESEAGIRTTLCRRLHRASIAPGSGRDSLEVGMIRFTVDHTPHIADLSQTTPGSPEWDRLPWILGASSRDMGLCQANVSIELNMDATDPRERDTLASPIPYFGSATRRYEFRP